MLNRDGRFSTLMLWFPRPTNRRLLSAVFLMMLMVGAFSVLTLISGCSSRNLRPDFKNEGEVLRREWNYSIEPISSSFRGGMEYVSPVVYENVLLFGSERYGILALYPKIQRPKWKIEIPNGIVSEIEVADDQTYFTGGDGNVYSVSLDTGKTNWTYALRNPVASRPTVSGDDLFLVTSDDALVALEAKTGKWKWHYRRRNTTGPVVHGASKPLVVGDSVWVGFADGALVVVSRKEGKVLWERQLNTNKRFSSVNAEFLLDDGVVYIPAYDGALYALNARNGNPIWVKDGIGGSKSVAIRDRVLYAPSSNGYLYALDPKNGKEFWKFELDQGVPSDIVVTEKHVLFSSSSEYLYGLTKEGKLVYRYQVGYGSGFSGGLAYDSTKGVLYALSRGGNLLSFRYTGK